MFVSAPDYKIRQGYVTLCAKPSDCTFYSVSVALW